MLGVSVDQQRIDRVCRAGVSGTPGRATIGAFVHLAATGPGIQCAWGARIDRQAIDVASIWPNAGPDIDTGGNLVARASGREDEGDQKRDTQETS